MAPTAHHRSIAARTVGDAPHIPLVEAQHIDLGRVALHAGGRHDLRPDHRGQADDLVDVDPLERRRDGQHRFEIIELIGRGDPQRPPRMEQPGRVES